MIDFLKKYKETLAYTSVMTVLEIESAIQRRLNEKSITAVMAEVARTYSRQFCEHLSLMDMNVEAIDIALYLQKKYLLRPGDSIQLASARLCHANSAQISFLSFDNKLNKAAQDQGFQVPFIIS